MSDPLEILDAIDRERGESFIGMIQANQVQRLRDEIVALREAIGIVRDAACEPDNSYFHDNIWQAVQKMLDMVDALKGKAP